VKRWTLATLALVIGATPSHAHLVTSGLGPLYDGALHFVLSPDDVLAVIAVALFAGLRGPAPGRIALVTLPACWVIGLLLSPLIPLYWMNGAKAGLIFAVGGLAAMNLALPKWSTVVAAALIGIIFGADNGASLVATPSTLAGLAIGIVVTLALLLGLVISITLRLGDVPGRVAGSWAAATGLLMAGWAFRQVGHFP
jgi:urease accessory protein